MRSKRSGRKKFILRTTAVIMALIMSLTCWPAAYAGVEKENALTSEEISKVSDAMENVIGSIEELQKIGVITSEDGFSIATIFSSFADLTEMGMSIGTFFSKTTAFLELIGIVKNAKTQAMVNIAQSLVNINEKLAVMDRKLDEISEQMTVMQANEEFNTRANKATQMLSEWHSFEHDYVEEKMDRLMNEYDSMMLNHTSDWINDKEGARQRDNDGLRTDRIVLLYKADGSGEGDAGLTAVPAPVNDIEAKVKKGDVARPDPYTMYADDEDLDLRSDRFLILDESYLPAKGDIRWNVDTYRGELKTFFVNKMKGLREDAKAGGSLDPGKVKEYNMFISNWTEEDIDRYAEGAVNSLLYRINYVMLNESSDFARNVHKEFGEYCKHVASSQQGVDAMLRTIFLTHAFEYETAEDINAFCNQMILKTGVYSMFAANIEGMSEFITESQKTDTAKSMTDAITSLQGLLDNSIMGNGKYCYVTNSILNYADVTIKGGVHAQYHTRGMVAGFDSYTADKMDTSYSSDEKIGDQPQPVGDANALVIGYLLRNNGQTMDHDYLNEHFSTTKRTKKSALITSLKGTQRMGTDSPVLMRTHNTIGGYFKGNPEVHLNRLPGSAGETYLPYREQMTGSVLNPETLSLRQNQALFATALYAENHWFWEVDEVAVMGGPVDDPSFKDSYSVKRIDVGLVTDTHQVDYSNSVEYNCLLQVPVETLRIQPGPFILDDLKDLTGEIREIAQNRSELSEAIDEVGRMLRSGNWTDASSKKCDLAMDQAKAVIGDRNSSADAVKAAKASLLKAQKGLETKRAQAMKVKASSKNVKRKALKKGKKTIKAITVKKAGGEVTYTMISVGKKTFTESLNEKYSVYFSVNEKTGKITVRKGIRKGTYRIKVKVAAAGNGTYLPGDKTVIVKIRIK